jgi:hypothetical protein
VIDNEVCNRANEVGEEMSHGKPHVRLRIHPEFIATCCNRGL